VTYFVASDRVHAGHRAAPRSTVKLNIMPLCMCSAIWQ
jgi:hypothetical protein